MLDSKPAHPASTARWSRPGSWPAVAHQSPAAARAPRCAAAEARLARYLAGWATADLARIAAAVAADYRFEDPLVGVFDRQGLGAYLAILRQRVGFATPGVPGCKVWFQPYPRQPGPGRIRFWRSLPETGLTGPSVVEFDAPGVRREVVCYETSLATEQLRRL